jgi:iron complex outermembrane receptor protein
MHAILAESQARRPAIDRNATMAAFLSFNARRLVRRAFVSLWASMLATLTLVASAQSAAPPMVADSPASAPAAVQLSPITVTGRSPTGSVGIGGFGDVPLARSPLQASVVTEEQWRDSGGTGLSALTRFDASVSDAYNADGYWTSFTVRGFAIDNQHNFLRDGLPINAETSLPLDNKALVEILKGTSGIQAGTSAPGGLVNLVVKRPEGTFGTASLGWRENGTFGASADISGHFGAQDAFGLRLNVVDEHIEPQVRDDKGRRGLLALAGNWRIDRDTLLEAEIETSRQSQPSVPGFSLLGAQLPDAKNVDARINLNSQPWSLPVVLVGTTGSLRLQKHIAGDWKLIASAALQRLRSDDRLAFSYGCSKEGNYDRYCSDGTFDYYAYRSDNERRSNDALDVHAEGALGTGTLKHRLTFGALANYFTLRTQPQANDNVIVGTGSVDGLTIVPSLPADLGTIPNTNRTERSTELYARDHVELTNDLGLWLGLRHSQLYRGSLQTDGTEATAYAQSFTTPWLAASYALRSDLLVYVSWGQGVESAVAPNRPGYTNPGQPLPALKSRQFEVGIKQTTGPLDWSLTGFDIDRPQYDDVSTACSSGTPCLTTRIDGHVRNQGLEAAGRWTSGNLSMQSSAMWLKATILDNSDAALNGNRPTNVPQRTLKLNGNYALASMQGLGLQAGIVYEGDRMVLPDNSVRIPGWTRIDLGARYQHKAGTTTLTWLVGVDNAANRRAWRESPYEYQHVYLFPLAPRTWRVSVQANL